jgi:glucose-6-phosphate dehydrogenase assembly protein OpcA
MTAALSPERILKELSELWTGHAKTDEAGTLRACAMTLIIAANEEEESSVLGEMVMELMHDHPSRAIVLRVRDGSDAALDSRVTALCWKPFGRRQQICCEQIELHASEGGLIELPRILLGLIVPDLPVVLICRTEKLFSLPAFYPLMRLAGKIIVDSRTAPRAVRMFEQIARRRSEGYVVEDLGWTAITRWRETIASAFEDPQTLASLRGIQRIGIVHSERGPGPEAFYLGAWLARGIGMRAGVEFSTGREACPIQRVELEGKGIALSFSHETGPILKFECNGIANNLPVALSSDWDLLRDELSILGRDRVYEEVLPGAIALAGG